MATESGHDRAGARMEAAIQARARGQHGVISRSQLLHLGLTPSAIKNRVRRRSLHALHRGVYSVGSPMADQRGRWMAAVLACGRDALLSHRSAAELWGMVRLRGGSPEVSVPIADKHRPDGVVVHRRRVLTSLDRRARCGIPVTSPIRTLADVARHLTDAQLEAAVNEAVMTQLVELERLRAALPEMHGTARLRRALDRQIFRLTESELERMFLRLVRSTGLPVPETGVPLNGFRVDFFWPRLGLVVETDGLRYHGTPVQQARDRRRDQAHTAAGLTVLRFTHTQIRFQAAGVRETLARVVTRLSRRAAA